MQPGRIAELLKPFLGPASNRSEPGRSEAQGLTADNLERISTYIDLLLRWNARINLTAIRDPEEIVTRHFGESLFAARHLFPQGNHTGTAGPGCPAEPSPAAAGAIANAAKSKLPHRPNIPNAQPPAPDARPTVADIGSGAGFPGLPIKLWLPEISLTLIESNQKKSTFLREVTRALTLTNVNIQSTRAEALAGTTFDVVTLRAVEHFESILSTAATLVAPKGRLALLIGTAQLSQTKTTLPSQAWSDPIPVPLSRSRVMVLAQRAEPNA